MGTLSVDRLGPVSCGVFPPYISLGLAHLTCSMLDWTGIWRSGYPEAGSKPRTLCRVS